MLRCMNDTAYFIQLPDGSFAVLHRAMDWGQVVIILLLVGIFFVQLYTLWHTHSQPVNR
jgi:hypothetical protein